MTKAPNDVIISGIGLVSSLGVGVDQHIDILSSNDVISPQINDEVCAPYPVHTLPEINWTDQIPRRGDQRQMENWQRLGVFSAGLALDDAGFKDDLDACSTMDMIVAAGGGERDIDADSLVIEEARSRNDRDILLNEKLRTEIRPTLFLAQLSNLLAGNISIVHKVTGSSRTFMGEEGAGISAIDTAHARIASGQSTHCLVGGAFIAERDDLLFTLEAINELEMSPARPLWQRHPKDRDDRGGIVLGTIGAFLILESREHVEKRNGKIYAQLDKVAGDCGSRAGDSFNKRLATLAQSTDASEKDNTLIVSGASGATDITEQEKRFIESNYPNSVIRSNSALFGHSFEAQFPLGVALAAIALNNDGKIGAFAHDMDASKHSDLTHAIVTTFGHKRSEGIATLSKG